MPFYQKKQTKKRLIFIVCIKKNYTLYCMFDTMTLSKETRESKNVHQYNVYA